MLVPLDDLGITRKRKAIEYLRLFMMDTVELNRLLRRKEYSDTFLEFALQMTMSDWNTTTPVLFPVSWSNFPSLYLLMHGGAIQCLKSGGIYQSRNELTYNSGGTNIVRANKTAYYQSWIQNFAAEFEAKKLSFKIQQNVSQGFGGFHSEYLQIGYDW
jgi:hypothetical protein